jgi:hypothetical protein
MKKALAAYGARTTAMNSAMGDLPATTMLNEQKAHSAVNAIKHAKLYWNAPADWPVSAPSACA